MCEQQADGVRVEYAVGSRHLEVVLEANGGALVREYGGPIYQMGAIFNRRSETVRAWETQVGPELHQRVLEAAVEASFPVARQQPMLYPGEVIHRMRLYCGDEWAEMGLVDRLRDAHPLLKAVDGELSHLGYRLSQEGGVVPQEVPNPDLADWEEGEGEPGVRWPLRKPLYPAVAAVSEVASVAVSQSPSLGGGGLSSGASQGSRLGAEERDGGAGLPSSLRGFGVMGCVLLGIVAMLSMASLMGVAIWVLAR